MNHLENVNLEQVLKEKFPAEGKEMRQWFYGRFGNKQWFEENHYSRSKEIMKDRYIIGNSYLDFGNSKVKKYDKLDRSTEIRMQEEQKEDEVLHMVKKRGKSIDYLKQLRKITKSKSSKNGMDDSMPLRNS